MFSCDFGFKTSRHVASHADVLRGSSRVPAPPMSGEHLSKVCGAGTRDQPPKNICVEGYQTCNCTEEELAYKAKTPHPSLPLIFPVIRPKTSSVADCYCERRRLSVPRVFLIGSLSNDDGNGNDNGKKAIGLNWQNNNFARVSRFFVHFLAVVARLRLKSAYFHVLSRTCTQDNDFLFLFLNFDPVF